MLNIGNKPISWHSKLQNEITQLSCLAEHQTCAETTKKIYECEISLNIWECHEHNLLSRIVIFKVALLWPIILFKMIALCILNMNDISLETNN
jgi:hypothetical protein